MFKAAVLTVSDKAYAGEREDLAGPRFRGAWLRRATRLSGARSSPTSRTDRRNADFHGSHCRPGRNYRGTGFSVRTSPPRQPLRYALALPRHFGGHPRMEHENCSNGHAFPGSGGIRGRTVIVNLPEAKSRGRMPLIILPPLVHGLSVLREKQRIAQERLNQERVAKMDSNIGKHSKEKERSKSGR